MTAAAGRRRWIRTALPAAVAAVVMAMAAACSTPAVTSPAHPAVPTTVPSSSPRPSGAGTSPVPTAPPVPATPLPAPAGDLPVGPGTLATYTVQPQPAPGACHYRWVGTDPLPDPGCTPGATNPQVTPTDLATTVCAPGWTATVRPPTSVTGSEKAASAVAYGYQGPSSTAEYDHLVPLELGGDPNDPANLWLEPNDRPGATSFANAKDGLENRLRELVCAGQLPLAAAQRAIATDWAAALRHYGP